MGTRADFYVGRGVDAEWLGSIAWDGYPDGVPHEVLKASSGEDFRTRVEAILATDRSATRPDMGWPWPWEDSCTTDYAYAWDDGVQIACFGYRWETPEQWEEKKEAVDVEDDDDQTKHCVFPNMTARMNFTMGERSGVILVGLK